VLWSRSVIRECSRLSASQDRDIESDARVKGSLPKLLWNGGFWDSPRGAAALLDAEGELSRLRPTI